MRASSSAILPFPLIFMVKQPRSFAKSSEGAAPLGGLVGAARAGRASGWHSGRPSGSQRREGVGAGCDATP